MTNMKKVLITMMLLLTLTVGVDAASQKHRHTSQTTTELVDSTNKDAVEAFSDTTTSAQTPAQPVTDWDDDDDDDVRHTGLTHFTFGFDDAKDLTGMLFVLAVLLIIFVLAPVFIIIALFYFINKNRKDKMRLAQMAVQQGQPIPDQLLEDKLGNDADEYQKGMRQCFVGVGLMVFLGYAAGQVGFGIGALVFCIGLGKVFASRTAKRNNDINNDLTKEEL